jgi:hypothetical protein
VITGEEKGPATTCVTFNSLPRWRWLRRRQQAVLVGKLAWNSAEFRDYSNSRPFKLQNFHRNFIFPIMKCVPANSAHVPAGSESSPTIGSSNFMNRKTFPLYLSVASGIKF